MKSSNWCLPLSRFADKGPFPSIISTILSNLTTHSPLFSTKAFRAKHYEQRTIWYLRGLFSWSFCTKSNSQKITWFFQKNIFAFLLTLLDFKRDSAAVVSFTSSKATWLLVLDNLILTVTVSLKTLFKNELLCNKTNYNFHRVAQKGHYRCYIPEELQLSRHWFNLGMSNPCITRVATFQSFK